MEVLFGTSSDSRHPAEHAVDGKPNTFWSTTGMFPQELVLSLGGSDQPLKRVSVTACDGADLLYALEGEERFIFHKSSSLNISF